MGHPEFLSKSEALLLIFLFKRFFPMRKKGKSFFSIENFHLKSHCLSIFAGETDTVFLKKEKIISIDRKSSNVP